jgi:hypothetical protein
VAPVGASVAKRARECRIIPAPALSSDEYHHTGTAEQSCRRSFSGRAEALTQQNIWTVRSPKSCRRRSTRWGPGRSQSGLRPGLAVHSRKLGVRSHRLTCGFRRTRPVPTVFRWHPICGAWHYRSRATAPTRCGPHPYRHR